ncbi:MAG: saccharopine dehydrogenase NADP-binding domain-containing protein [Sphingobacteriales bacterium]|nr:saccharopine dehydrogenase NADP-binding domain-containing protein [Sphingobacteriales bacterium]
MPENKILILGGYGQTGFAAAKLLLQETNVSLVLAGRDLTKAKAAAAELNRPLAVERADAVYADASEPATLVQAFKGMDLVLVTSSTASYTHTIAGAALEAGCDYMDIHFGPAVYRQLQMQEEQIKNKGRCFISGGGFHPGMPAIMTRYSALFFDELQKARTAGLMKIDFSTYKASPSTRREFVEELADFNPMYYEEGHWKKMNMLTGRGMAKIDFGNKYGTHTCSPLFFEELRPLPQLFPTLTDTGFYIAGFNGITDYLVFPLVMGVQKILPRRFNGILSRLMVWSIKTFTRPPYGYLMRLEASGLKNGRPKNIQLSISSTDPALITAIPVVACLKQYLLQKKPVPGLFLQGLFAEPLQFIEDCRKMGLPVEIRENGGEEKNPASPCGGQGGQEAKITRSLPTGQAGK